MAEKYLPFYNVENSVGSGVVNKSEDIMLVQLFFIRNREIAAPSASAAENAAGRQRAGCAFAERMDSLVSESGQTSRKRNYC